MKRAGSCIKRCKLSDAERAYKKALKINPNFVEALNNLGNVFVDKGRLTQASDAFRKALKFLPDNPMLLNNLGNAMQLSRRRMRSRLDGSTRRLLRIQNMPMRTPI